MKTPDIIYLYRPPFDSSQSVPAALVEAAAHGMVVSTQSLPTHLMNVMWRAQGFDVQWVLLLRADDTAEIIECNGDRVRFQQDGWLAARRLLRVLRIPVTTGGTGLGEDRPMPPTPLKGVYPGDKEFAALIAQPEFVRWLKSLCAPEED